MKVTAIITCAGKGERAQKGKNKILAKLDGVTVLEKVLDAFYFSGVIDEIILTSSKEDFEEISALSKGKATVTLGGGTRTQSVKNALDKATGEIALIHDGARPFVTKKVISDCIESVKTFGSGITACPTVNTIAKGRDGFIDRVLGKSDLFTVQTPQGFFTKDIKKAYSFIEDESFPDDSAVYLKYIGKPRLSLGDEKNIKLTFKEDFESDFLVGTGFDCHRLVENRKLILGGVEIPHDKGLLGHSDADVLTHAVMDAILSAIHQRDIGYHFSDKDERFKDISSIILLKEVLKMLSESGYALKNVSAVIQAEKPKLLKHIPIITKTLSGYLEIPEDRLGITATTLEGLGFVGREEGICVQASCLLVKK